MEERDVLKRLILQKLVRGNIWGGKHTPLEFVSNGIPQHYRDTRQGKKMLEKTLRELVSDEWITLLPKRTGKGSDDHISLNPRKVGEIKYFLSVP